VAIIDLPDLSTKLRILQRQPQLLTDTSASISRATNYVPSLLHSYPFEVELLLSRSFFASYPFEVSPQ